MTTPTFKEKKEMFLNCGCNYAGTKQILYGTVCGNPYTGCKQCSRSLTPIGREIVLFKDKETAERYRKHIFKNPERALLNFCIPGLGDSIHI